MSLLPPDTDIADYGRVRVLLFPTDGTPPAIFAREASALMEAFAFVPLASLPLSPNDPYLQPFVSSVPVSSAPFFGGNAGSISNSVHAGQEHSSSSLGLPFSNTSSTLSPGSQTYPGGSSSSSLGSTSNKHDVSTSLFRPGGRGTLSQRLAASAACIHCSFQTPQYVLSEWADLHMHKQILAAIAISASPLPAFEAVAAAAEEAAAWKGAERCKHEALGGRDAEKKEFPCDDVQENSEHHSMKSSGEQNQSDVSLLQGSCTDKHTSGKKRQGRDSPLSSYQDTRQEGRTRVAAAAAKAAVNAVRREYEQFRKILEEDYPSVLVHRLFVVPPPSAVSPAAAAFFAPPTRPGHDRDLLRDAQRQLDSESLASALASVPSQPYDEHIVYFPPLLSDDPRVSSQIATLNPSTTPLFAAAKEDFFLCLLKQLGALTLRSADRCPPLLTPLDSSSLQPPTNVGGGANGLLSASSSFLSSSHASSIFSSPRGGTGPTQASSQLQLPGKGDGGTAHVASTGGAVVTQSSYNSSPTGSPRRSPFPLAASASATTSSSALLRLLPARLQKQVGDALLLGGAPASAAAVYVQAAEACRTQGDSVWQAAAIEGQAAAIYAFIRGILLQLDPRNSHSLVSNTRALDASRSGSGDAASDRSVGNASDTTAATSSAHAGGAKSSSWWGFDGGGEGSTDSNAHGPVDQTGSAGGNLVSFPGPIEAIVAQCTQRRSNAAAAGLQFPSFLPGRDGSAGGASGGPHSGIGGGGGSGVGGTGSGASTERGGGGSSTTGLILGAGALGSTFLGGGAASHTQQTQNAGGSNVAGGASGMGGAGGGLGLDGTLGGSAASSRQVVAAVSCLVQSAVDAACLKLRDAAHLYHCHPGCALLHASTSLVLCRLVAQFGSKIESLQLISSVAEKAKRLEVQDFVACLSSLAALCSAIGAFRKLAFLLHRVCMALMEAKRWGAAHYAAAVAAPWYHLALLELPPGDQLHPLALLNGSGSVGPDLAASFGLVGPAASSSWAGHRSPVGSTRLIDGLRQERQRTAYMIPSSLHDSYDRTPFWRHQTAAAAAVCRQQGLLDWDALADAAVAASCSPMFAPPGTESSFTPGAASIFSPFKTSGGGSSSATAVAALGGSAGAGGTRGSGAGGGGGGSPVPAARPGMMLGLLGKQNGRKTGGEWRVSSSSLSPEDFAFALHLLRLRRTLRQQRHTPDGIRSPGGTSSNCYAFPPPFFLRRWQASLTPAPLSQRVGGGSVSFGDGEKMLTSLLPAAMGRGGGGVIPCVYPPRPPFPVSSSASLDFLAEHQRRVRFTWGGGGTFGRGGRGNQPGGGLPLGTSSLLLPGSSVTAALGGGMRVWWPAVQSRVLHILKISSEHLGDPGRVAWYACAALKVLYPVIDHKAQANTIMLIQAAAGRKTTPLALPPSLTVMSRRAPGNTPKYLLHRPRGVVGASGSGVSSSQRAKTGRGAIGFGSTAGARGGGSGGLSSGSHRSTQDDHLQFVGGMCQGAAPPLPLLARIQPVIDASVVLREVIGDSSLARNLLEEGGPLISDAGGKQKSEVAVQNAGGGDGSSKQLRGWCGKADEIEDTRTDGAEGGADKKKDVGEEEKKKPVLMYNPFAHKSRLTGGTGGRAGGGAGGGLGEDDELLSAAGQWVKGELRTVQVSVRNPLGVELVLDKAKVMTCGAHAEVYPVTVLVPPSATHQVTFEVTVLPKEEGRLYFTGLTYTLNKLQCTQLLLNQSSRLAAILDLQQQAGDSVEKSSAKKTSQSSTAAKGTLAMTSEKKTLLSSPGASKTIFGGDKRGGAGSLWRSKIEAEDKPVEDDADRQIESLLQVTEASVDLLKFSAAACVEVVAELPLLRVSVEAHSTPSPPPTRSLLGSSGRPPSIGSGGAPFYGHQGAAYSSLFYPNAYPSHRRRSNTWSRRDYVDGPPLPRPVRSTSSWLEADWGSGGGESASPSGGGFVQQSYIPSLKKATRALFSRSFSRPFLTQSSGGLSPSSSQTARRKDPHVSPSREGGGGARGRSESPACGTLDSARRGGQNRPEDDSSKSTSGPLLKGQQGARRLVRAGSSQLVSGGEGSGGGASRSGGRLAGQGFSQKTMEGGGGYSFWGRQPSRKRIMAPASSDELQPGDGEDVPPPSSVGGRRRGWRGMWNGNSSSGEGQKWRAAGEPWNAMTHADDDYGADSDFIRQDDSSTFLSSSSYSDVDEDEELARLLFYRRDSSSSAWGGGGADGGRLHRRRSFRCPACRYCWGYSGDPVHSPGWDGIPGDDGGNYMNCNLCDSCGHPSTGLSGDEGPFSGQDGRLMGSCARCQRYGRARSREGHDGGGGGLDPISGGEDDGEGHFLSCPAYHHPHFRRRRSLHHRRSSGCGSIGGGHSTAVVGGGDPRHSPVWEGQHRILSVQIENVGRVPVRDLQFDLLKADGEPPANEEEAAILKKHFQVLWHPGCRPSSLGPSGTVIYSEDALLQIAAGGKEGENTVSRRGPRGLPTDDDDDGGTTAEGLERQSRRGSGAKRRRKMAGTERRQDDGPSGTVKDENATETLTNAHYGSENPSSTFAAATRKTRGMTRRGNKSNRKGGLGAKGGGSAGDTRVDDEKEKKRGSGTLSDSQVLISPGQKVRMPLRCIASAECSSCIIRISYSHNPSSSFHRQVLQPLSLRVQTGLQLRPQGLNIFPLVFFGHQAVLKTFFSFPTLFSRDGSLFPLLFSPSFSSPSSSVPAAHPNRGRGEKVPWASLPDSDATGVGGEGPSNTGVVLPPHAASRDVLHATEDLEDVQGFSAAGGAFRKMLTGHMNTTYPSSPTSLARGTELGGRKVGVARPDEDIIMRPGFSGFASSVLSTLTHRFDHRSCLVCIDLQNFASVAFECFTAWAGGTSGGRRGTEPAACCLAPNDSQCRWALWVRRPRLSRETLQNASSVVEVLDKELDIHWRCFPSQEGTLKLLTLLQRAAASSSSSSGRTSRGRGSSPERGEGGAGGGPGQASSRSSSSRPVNSSGGGGGRFSGGSSPLDTSSSSARRRGGGGGATRDGGSLLSEENSRGGFRRSLSSSRRGAGSTGRGRIGEERTGAGGWGRRGDGGEGGGRDEGDDDENVLLRPQQLPHFNAPDLLIRPRVVTQSQLEAAGTRRGGSASSFAGLLSPLRRRRSSRRVSCASMALSYAPSSFEGGEAAEVPLGPEPYPVLSNRHLTSQTAPLSPRPSVQWAPLMPGCGGEDRDDYRRRAMAANIRGQSFSRGGGRTDEEEEDEGIGRRETTSACGYDPVEQGELTPATPAAVRLGPDCYKIPLHEPVTLQVYVENRHEVPLHHCTVFVIPFVHGSSRVPDGLLWSGSLSHDLIEPIPTSRSRRMQARRLLSARLALLERSLVRSQQLLGTGAGSLSKGVNSSGSFNPLSSASLEMSRSLSRSGDLKPQVNSDHLQRRRNSTSSASSPSQGPTREAEEYDMPAKGSRRLSFSRSTPDSKDASRLNDGEGVASHSHLNSPGGTKTAAEGEHDPKATRDAPTVDEAVGDEACTSRRRRLSPLSSSRRRSQSASGDTEGGQIHSKIDIIVSDGGGRREGGGEACPDLISEGREKEKDGLSESPASKNDARESFKGNRLTVQREMKSSGVRSKDDSSGGRMPSRSTREGGGRRRYSLNEGSGEELSSMKPGSSMRLDVGGWDPLTAKERYSRASRGEAQGEGSWESTMSGNDYRWEGQGERGDAGFAGPSDLPESEDLAKLLGVGATAAGIRRLERRHGAVLCHRVTLMACVPGMFNVAVAVLVRPDNVMWWHYQPVRLIA
ncbi:transport protein trs120 [Cystoisospora suis]|uniref:Transport protein trs120 n=1 Tax=Cystoisospora suis TaxID=483139 RepID=A0A2C6KTJ0_9APIC|nr:transport protein trs120 [Cystoisospora suis]